MCVGRGRSRGGWAVTGCGFVQRPGCGCIGLCHCETLRLSPVVVYAQPLCCDMDMCLTRNSALRRTSLLAAHQLEASCPRDLDFSAQ